MALKGENNSLWTRHERIEGLHCIVVLMVQKIVNKLKVDQFSNTSGKVNSSASKICIKTLFPVPPFKICLKLKK